MCLMSTTLAPDRPVALRSTPSGAATRRPLTGFLFVLPTAVTVLTLFVVPLGILVWMSLSDWPLLGQPKFVGLENFAAIAQHKQFVGAVRFTLVYTVLTTICVFGLSFVLVAVSNSRRRGVKFYRTAFFLPYVISAAAASLIWVVDINDGVGVFPKILRTLGLAHGTVLFTDTPWAATWTVIAMVTWKFIGLQVIVLLVGLQSVPEELYEAARCDGANAWQRLVHITAPQLRPTIALLLVLSVTGSLLAFDQFMIITGGGPDNSTITMVMAIYKTAFNAFDLGKAAAMSVVLLVSLVLLNGLQLRLVKGRDS
jgi:multiple sugar transport system permease protein